MAKADAQTALRMSEDRGIGPTEAAGIMFASFQLAHGPGGETP
jgi:hypothetical protein